MGLRKLFNGWVRGDMRFFLMDAFFFSTDGTLKNRWEFLRAVIDASVKFSGG
jgi:hypothetical protein